MMSPAQRSNRAIAAVSAAISLLTIIVVAVPRGDSSPKATSSSPTSTVVPTSSTATSTTEVTTEDDERWIDFEPAAPIVSVFPDERLPAVSTPSDLDDSVPSRPAALVPHPFEHALDDEATGLTEPAFARFHYHLNGRPFSCSSISSQARESDDSEPTFYSCGHARTPRGDFLLVARTAGLNHYDGKHVAAVAIDVFTLRRTPTGKRVAAVVSKAYISRDLCSPGSYVEVGKIRVGDDEVFVVDVDGQLSVLAMNDEGMPEVVASYQNLNQEYGFAVGATDVSLVLGSERPYPFYTVREIFPSDAGWRERIHLLEVADLEDQSTNNDPRWILFEQKLAKPSTLATYQFLGYADDSVEAACDPVYRRTVYAD